MHPCAAAEGTAGRFVPALRGGCPPGQPGGSPHLSGFPRRSGHGLPRKGGRGNYPRGGIQPHPNSVPLSHAPRSRHRAPPGAGFPRDPHVSGLGRGDGTAVSCQAGGLRSEKAIFRGGSSGETKSWLCTYAPVLELFLRETREDPRPRSPHPAWHTGRREGARTLSARPLCLLTAHFSSPALKAPDSGTSWEPSLFILNSLLCVQPKLLLPIPRLCASFPARWQHRAGGVSF